MDADDATAFRARPSFSLTNDKRIKPNLSQTLKVFDHAHAVFRSVAFVQLPESRAGEFRALKTELLFSQRQLFAVSDPTHDAMLWFVSVIAVAAGATLLLSEMADTEPAVHPARRNHR